ncbi:hypothetical protein C8R43DRAFT_1119371 [Mycena crocata]|nr:hypothetical protein C8R43DRAFT_1119371 [Mycena crocata]
MYGDSAAFTRFGLVPPSDSNNEVVPPGQRGILRTTSSSPRLIADYADIPTIPSCGHSDMQNHLLCIHTISASPRMCRRPVSESGWVMCRNTHASTSAVTATTTATADTDNDDGRGGSSGQGQRLQHGGMTTRLGLSGRWASDQPTFPNTPLPPTSTKGLSWAPTTSCALNWTSTLSSSTPTTSPTTSLIADGGDDVENGPRHSGLPPPTSPDAENIAVVVADNLALAVFGGADGLGALSAQSAHLSAVGTISAHRNALTTRSPTPAAHFGSDGALAFMGFIRHPRPLFPTVELAPTRFPRPDRKCATSGALLLPMHPSTHPTPPAPDGTLRIKPPVRIFQGIGSLCAIPQLSTYRSPDLAIQNLPERRLEYPWELFSVRSTTVESLVQTPRSSSSEQTVSDWVLPPRTSKFLTSGVNANFGFKWYDCISLYFNFDFMFVLRAGFRLDLAAIHPNPEILRAEGRDYLQIENGSLDTVLTLELSLFETCIHLRAINAEAMLFRSFKSSPTLSYSASKPLPGWDTYLSSSLTTLRLEYFMSGFIDAYLCKFLGTCLAIIVPSIFDLCAGTWCRSGEFGKASIPSSDLYDLCWDLGVNSRPRRHRHRIPVAPSPAPPLNSVISQNANVHCKTRRDIDRVSPTSAPDSALCQMYTEDSFPQLSVQSG